MRNSWTDDRLDALNRRVDEGFTRVDEHFAQVDQRFVRLEGELHAMRSEINLRFDSLQRTMIQFGGVMIVALVGFIATQL